MIFTIGYEGLDIERFLAALKASGIRILVDVREMPLSRKKGFSKSPLSKALQDAGIEYLHLKTLGAPKDVRYKLRENGDWDEYCAGFNGHLREDVTQEALKEVAELAADRPIALMCFEANYRECHRSLITDWLTQEGVVDGVTHLAPQKGSPSALSEVA